MVVPESAVLTSLIRYDFSALSALSDVSAHAFASTVAPGVGPVGVGLLLVDEDEADAVFEDVGEDVVEDVVEDAPSSLPPHAVRVAVRPAARSADPKMFRM
ncbi:hypothetical protein GCM10027599_26190 [Yimella radicis]